MVTPHRSVEGHTGSCGGFGFRSEDAFRRRFVRFGERGSAGKARTQANADEETTMSTVNIEKLDVLWMNIVRITAALRVHRKQKDIESTESFEMQIGTIFVVGFRGGVSESHVYEDRI